MTTSYESSQETVDRCVTRESFTLTGALTDVEFWKRQQVATASETDDSRTPAWYPALSCFMPRSPDTTFLEVGVVPGRVLLFFAQTLHYRCTGVDFSPQIRHLPALFTGLGVEARFLEADFFSWTNDEVFDIVYSNGFIEHFTNCETVILKHWDRVAPGGLMILAVPTFTTPVQWWIRQVFYEPRLLQETLAAHNLTIMNLDALKECVLKVCPKARDLKTFREPGLPIWFDSNTSGVRRGFGYDLLWLLLKVSDRIMRIFGISCKWCAGVAVIMVKKPEV